MTERELMKWCDDFIVDTDFWFKAQRSRILQIHNKIIRLYDRSHKIVNSHKRRIKQ